MNRTELRHLMLTVVQLNPGQITVRRSLSDGKPIYGGPRALTVGQKAALRAFDVDNYLRRGSGATPSMFSPRPLSLSKSGERLLAEWDEKYGPVTP